MEGIIPVEKYKHKFAKPPMNLPQPVRDKIIKENKQLLKQEQNYEYYKKNRKKILEYHDNLYKKKLGVKVKCPLCNRVVAQGRLKKHKETPLCKRFRNVKIINDFFNIKN